MERIVRYCENDMIAVTELLLRFNNLTLLENREIVKL